jgi:hypothetical protein
MPDAGNDPTPGFESQIKSGMCGSAVNRAALKKSGTTMRGRSGG